MAFRSFISPSRFSISAVSSSVLNDFCRDQANITSLPLFGNTWYRTRLCWSYIFTASTLRQVPNSLKLPHLLVTHSCPQTPSHLLATRSHPQIYCNSFLPSNLLVTYSHTGNSFLPPNSLTGNSFSPSNSLTHLLVTHSRPHCEVWRLVPWGSPLALVAWL